MAEDRSPARCERLSAVNPENPTLIEGLPGHGLVAAIAVEQITEQLNLDHHSNIQSEEFPPVTTFEDGLVRDLVRVYASDDPAVMTLESDLALPPDAFEPLSQCVLSDLEADFKKAIFIAGAPAQSEDQIGEIRGVATTPALKEELREVDIQVAGEHGVVGGITGALVQSCYHADIPAVLLIVRSHPQLPDPGAAKAVIEEALEPLVEFEIDTTELDEHAEEIQKQLRQIARQYEQASKDGGGQTEPQAMGMYQ